MPVSAPHTPPLSGPSRSSPEAPSPAGCPGRAAPGLSDYSSYPALPHLPVYPSVAQTVTLGLGPCRVCLAGPRTWPRAPSVLRAPDGSGGRCACPRCAVSTPAASAGCAHCLWAAQTHPRALGRGHREGLGKRSSACRGDTALPGAVGRLGLRGEGSPPAPGPAPRAPLPSVPGWPRWPPSSPTAVWTAPSLPSLP